MMLIADTLPSRRGGVTDCRKVVVLITHRIGPAPSRKKLKPASAGLGSNVVSAIILAATNPVTGPSPITTPNGKRLIPQLASDPPITLPTPSIARLEPAPLP